MIPGIAFTPEAEDEAAHAEAVQRSEQWLRLLMLKAGGEMCPEDAVLVDRALAVCQRDLAAHRCPEGVQ